MKKRAKFTENVLGQKMLQKKEELHNLFKSYRNFLNKIARLSKANYYKTFSEDNKNKLIKFGKVSKRLSTSTKKNTRQIRNISSNGKLITEKKQIVKLFNHFFCNIPEQIEKGIIPTQKRYDHFLTNPIKQSFKFNLTSDEEIITYIKTLKIIKAMDLSAFQINFLKTLRNPSVHFSPF